MTWWEIYSEAQYVRLRTANRPKIFLWYSGKLSLHLKNQMATLFEKLEKEFHNDDHFIISLVNVDRDPDLKKLFSLLKTSAPGPIVTVYSPKGATLLKCNATSFARLKNRIFRLLLFPQV